MKVLLINNDGGGFADYVEVEQGTTVDQLFAQHMGEVKPANYLIRVNRQPVPSSQVLQEGGRLVFRVDRSNLPPSAEQLVEIFRSEERFEFWS